MAPDERSILERLDEAGRPAPRVRLRTDEDASPGALKRSGRFEILGDLAVGGVGEVLKGRDVDLGRDVAIKVLRARHASNPDVVRRFVEEAQIGGQLQHPGVVPVYELGLQPGDDRPFFAMKLVKGRTLAALLRDRPELSSERRRFLEVFEQVCQTVAYAHRRGVIHRDLKPANVMVGAFGEVQVLDWGFAKVLARGGVADERAAPREIDVTTITTLRAPGAEGSESVAGSVMGTPAYMPPEQALGRVDELDERSDVFSLGAILCEVLTGQPPYVGEDAFVQAARVSLDDAKQRLRSCGADATLVALAERCLSPLRKQRPRDAAEVADTLHEHLASAEERAHRASLEAEATRQQAIGARMEVEQLRGARKLSVLLAASVLAAVVIGSGTWWWLQTSRRERTRRATDVVTAAMREAEAASGRAQERGDLAGWAEARAAAGRAKELAGAEDVEEEARRRATALAKRVAEEADAARSDLERRAREAAFLAELDGVRVHRLDPRSASDAEEEYGGVLRKYGIDPALATTAMAARVRERFPGALVPIASLFDEASYLRPRAEDRQRPFWQTLAGVAKAIDPDPWRTRLRDAVARQDLEALRGLASEADLDTISVRTLDLLGSALVFTASGDAEGGAAVLRRAWQRRPGDASILVDLADALWREDPPPHEEILRFLSANLALRPDDAAAHARLAHALQALGRGDDALAELRKATKLGPDTCWYWNLLGSALRDRGEYEEALGAFRRALQAHPGSAAHLSNAGVALTDLGRLDEAEGVLRKALEIDPRYARAWNNLGSVLYRTKRQDEAFVAYRKALEIDPGFAQAWINLAIDLNEAGRTAEAGEAWAAAVEASGDEPNLQVPSLVGEGRWLLWRGRFEESIARLKDAIRLDGKNVDARNGMSLALSRAGRAAEAESVAREAIGLDARNAEAHLNLGVALARQHHEVEAIAAFREALDLDKSMGIAHANLSLSLDKVGQYEESLAEAREAARLAPDHSLSWTALGIALVHQSHFQEGVAPLRRLLELDPDSYDGHAFLGVALFRLGQHAEAERHLRRAVALQPDSPFAYTDLGRLLARTDRLDEAYEMHQKALDLLSTNRDPRLDAEAGRAHECMAETCLLAGKNGEALPHARTGARLRPEDPVALSFYGLALERNGRYADAVKPLQRALALAREEGRPQVVRLLVDALQQTGRWEDALPLLREWVRRSGRDPDAQFSLARSLQELDQWEEAEKAYRAVIELSPGYAEAHCNLGLVLRSLYRFRESLSELRRGHELGTRKKDWAYPSAQWVAEAERLVRLDGLLAGVRAGGPLPEAPSELLDLTVIAGARGCPLLGVRLAEKALAAQPSLADDLGSCHRYNAACCAALAGCGRGDAGGLGAEERRHWRERSLAWLRADLALRRAQIDGRDLPGANPADQELAHWLRDSDLAGVRDAEALAELPNNERRAWTGFWSEVGQALAAAQGEK